MNLTYKKPLLLAIAAGLGMIPLTGVLAATTPRGIEANNANATAKPVYLPAESKESSSNYFSIYDAIATNASGAAISATSGDLSAYIYTIPGYTVKVGEQKTLIVKVTLTGGAKFHTAPVLICAHSAGAVKGDIKATMWGPNTFQLAANVTAVAYAASVTHGYNGTTAFYLNAINTTDGQASYSFAFPDGFSIPAGTNSGACILSLSAGIPYGAAALTNTYAASAIRAPAGTEVSMYAEVTYDEFFTKVTTTASIPMISFVTAYKGVTSATKADAQIDVGSSSKKFILGNATKLNAVAGEITVTAVDAAKTLRNATGLTPLTAGNVFESATITLSGPTISGLTKVTFHSNANMPADPCGTTVLMEGTVATTAPATGSTISLGTVAVTVTGGATPSAPFTRLVSGNVGLAMCLVTDGSKVMNNGMLSISLNGVSSSGKVIELANVADYYTVQRNGTVVRVLNIPLESTDLSKVNIRLFNTSSLPLTGVKGTVYGVDGTVIKEDLDLGTVPANGVKQVTSDSIIASLGTATAKGRAWMLIQAPISKDSFKVQALMKNPNGVLSNISTDALD